MTHARYYVTVIRGRRVGYLAGPFPSDMIARTHLPAVRKLASAIDPWTDFDLFGTASVSGHGYFPIGILNNRLELADA